MEWEEWEGLFKCLGFRIYSSIRTVAAFPGTKLRLSRLPTTMATGFPPGAGAAPHPRPSRLPRCLQEPSSRL